MKKYRLDTDYGKDILALGLVCDEADYKIAWKINQLLNIKLLRQPDMIYTPKNSPAKQKYCYYKSNDHAHNYHLIKNHSSIGTSLTDLRNIDYILIILPAESIVCKTIEKIRADQTFRGVFEVPKEKLVGINLH